MRLKKHISLLLLAVYLCTTTGMALVSLTCKCVSAARTEHVCCQDCREHAASAAADKAMGAPCCGDHHSTEIALYVFSNSDNNERYTRCAVTDLPPALAAECPCPAHVPLLREKTAERRTPFVREASILPVGFRAPPVLA